MRFLVCLLIIMTFHNSYGQDIITGKIRDKVSFKPLLNVKVQSGKSITYSNGQAEFRIAVKDSDSIVFTLPSYRRVVIQKDSLEGLKTIFVEMIEYSIPIEEITVKSKKVKKDTFQFKLNLGIPKTPKYREIVMDRSEVGNSAMMKANGSTSSLISVDLLAISRMLFKKKPKVDRQQQMEEDIITIQYIDMGFKIELIEKYTGLKGEEALVFQNTYRPSIMEYRNMTDVDIINHIKKSFVEYRSYEHDLVK